jgi:hypothetical protein
MNTVCSRCGTAGDSKTQTKGSTLIELILWCCMIVPGLIYSVWRRSSRQKVCRACGADALVPAISPIGQQLAAQFRTPVNVEAPTQKASAQRGYAWIAVGIAIVGWIVYVNAGSH